LLSFFFLSSISLGFSFSGFCDLSTFSALSGGFFLFVIFLFLGFDGLPFGFLH
jgi:hypothetical protein